MPLDLSMHEAHTTRSSTSCCRPGTAGLLYVGLARLDVLGDLETRCAPRDQVGTVLAIFTLGFTAGGLEEIWEWTDAGRRSRATSRRRRVALPFGFR